MVRIRAFEERLRAEVAAGRIPGRVHLAIGQEAIATGVCAHLGRADIVTSTHRGHGHALAKGLDPVAMMAEIFGRAGGCCGGKGGSMHLADRERGLLGANGIVGANAPLALGAALSAKTLGEERVAVAFVGDGGSNQGAVFESMNMATAFALPVLFVIEDNGYGEYTPRTGVTGTGDLAARAAAFGMPARTVDGCDVLAIHEAAREAVERTRKGEGPATLVAVAPRGSGHYEGDPQAYRPAARAPDPERDCLARFRRHALEARLLSESELDAEQSGAAAEMNAAVRAARSMPPPAPRALHADVLAAGPTLPS